jgi:hypothetical protein
MTVVLADTALIVMMTLSGLALLRDAPSGLLVAGSVGRRLPLALLLGTALHLLVGTGWLLTGLPGFLLPSFLLTILVALVLGGRMPVPGRWAVDRRAIMRSLVRSAALVATTAGLVLLARSTLREVVFEDSYDNTALAGLIVEGEFLRARPFLLLTRPPGLAVLQAPALAAGALYSIAPLVILSIATWAVVLDVADRTMRPHVHVLFRRGALVGALVAIVATPMVIAHMAHLNTHHLLAGFLLVAVIAVASFEDAGRTVTSGVMVGDSMGASAWITVALPSAAMVVLRPDGVFYALVVVVLSAFAVADWSVVRRVILMVGAVTFVWWGYLAARISGTGLWGGIEGGSSPFDIGSGRASATVPVLALGLALIVIGLLDTRCFAWSWRSSGTARLLVEAAPAGVLILVAVAERARFSRSLVAIRSNLFDGSGEWTLGPVVLLAGVAVLTLLTREGSQWVLRYLVTAFLPLLLALRIAEGGSYRIGWVDSLNRSLIHILPLVVLVLLVGTTRQLREWLPIRRQTLAPEWAARLTAGLAGIVALIVFLGATRTPSAFPLAVNARETDASLVAVLSALEPDEHVVVIIDGELSLVFARQLAASRRGWTELVSRSELEEVIAERQVDVVIAPECMIVPHAHRGVIAGVHLPRPGIENPNAQDWEQVREHGPDTGTVRFERWQMVRFGAEGSSASSAPSADIVGTLSEIGFDLPSRSGLLPAEGRGVVDHLGTRSSDLGSSVSRFRNPASLGLLCLDATSSLLGGLDGLTDRSGSLGIGADGGGIGLLHTDADPEAAVIIELGPWRRLDLTGIVIRQRPDEDANLVRGFRVEVRVDGLWSSVMTGRHDGGPGAWHEQQVDVEVPGADAIRISRDGLNSSGLGYLVLDDVELYGHLREQIIRP